MKTDRKWIVLASTLILILALAGCSKKQPETPAPQPPPEPVVTDPEPTDIGADPGAATADDMVEEPQEESLQDIQEGAERAGLLGDVFFDFDRYNLRPDARERLARNAEWMNTAGRGLVFTVEGHCDERGTNEYNLALGQNRATTAVDYLISLGVSGARFKTVSFGEERPFCTESTEACWQKNRRARFVISGRT